MDANLEELELKNLLVELEHEHQHLQVTVRHLKSAIEKRELDIKRLLALRELKTLQSRPNNNTEQLGPLRKSQTLDFVQLGIPHNQPAEHQRQPSAYGGDDLEQPEYSSDFTKQVSHLLDQVTKKADEVSALIKL